MFQEILAASTGLRTAGQMAKSLIDLKTMAEVHAKAVELNGLILEAQADLSAAHARQSTLIEEIRHLKDEIARMKDWETQKQRYKLAAAYAGCFVYAVKTAMSDGEPPHYICTNCYENGKRSVLQVVPEISKAHFECPEPKCKMRSPSGQIRLAVPKYLEELP